MQEGSVETWVRGTSVGERAADVCLGRAASVDAVAETLRPWAAFLRDSADSHGRLPGDFLDATPHNVVIDSAAVAHCIDREWISDKDLDITDVIVRGLVMFFVAVRDTGGLGARLARVPVARLVVQTARELGFSVSWKHLRGYAELQGGVLRQVHGYEGGTARLLRSLTLSSRARVVGMAGSDVVDLGRRASNRVRRVVRTRMLRGT